MRRARAALDRRAVAHPVAVTHNLRARGDRRRVVRGAIVDEDDFVGDDGGSERSVVASLRARMTMEMSITRLGAAVSCIAPCRAAVPAKGHALPASAAGGRASAQAPRTGEVHLGGDAGMTVHALVVIDPD